MASCLRHSINTPENSLHTKENLKINGGKTLEEAMDYYLWEIKPSMGLRGNFFTGRYRIIDTLETSSSVTVFAWVISTWVDTNGNTVSEGSSICEIGFKKEDNLYIYENHYYIKVPEFPYVPQKVSDILSNDDGKIYSDLMAEVDKDIENYLNSQ
ncbi:hypothetical protein [Candidatus Contubernalis alkaliaceticus]|uniref:hypothetical protein n=1 Tax=Candidatus Contubernalis alkaliaceticus TaxID=338645 RepID=UPI001F4BF92D|nr:hypothetical protein [Candidatus Contubernalis alkalaceticus]UNC91308.1 hypothetical protein HUE98_03910 [Candidatus Contubernalis alkalaceticus]